MLCQVQGLRREIAPARCPQNLEGRGGSGGAEQAPVNSAEQALVGGVEQAPVGGAEQAPVGVRELGCVSQAVYKLRCVSQAV